MPLTWSNSIWQQTQFTDSIWQQTQFTDSIWQQMNSYTTGTNGVLVTNMILYLSQNYTMITGQNPEQDARWWPIANYFEEANRNRIQALIQAEKQQQAMAAATAAASRADQLLMSLLDDSQAHDYTTRQRFDLKINGRTYRVTKGRSGNIQLIEDGKAVAKYCAHPTLWTPDGDTMIAQMLMLQTNEAEFLRLANRTAL